MATTVKDNSNGEFQRCPEGTHVAICYLFANIGEQTTQFGTKRECILGWELPHEKMTDGRPLGTSKRYTASINKLAKLCEHLESWRGRPFTDEERKGFEMANILGKACQLQIIHEKKGDKTYEEVKSIVGIPKGMVVPPRTNDIVCYDIDNHDQAMFDKLPKWIQDKVRKALPPSPSASGFDERNPPPAGMDDDVPFNRAPAHA